MTAALTRGPIVIDTDVYGAELVPGSALAVVYQPIVVGRPAFISFQTAAELRYGALRRNWGDSWMRKLEARIAAAETVHTGPSRWTVRPRRLPSPHTSEYVPWLG
ncbi:MAG: PIN domain-containing protein [Acidimicrobiales bacterium]